MNLKLIYKYFYKYFSYLLQNHRVWEPWYLQQAAYREGSWYFDWEEFLTLSQYTPGNLLWSQMQYYFVGGEENDGKYTGSKAAHHEAPYIIFLGLKCMELFFLNFTFDHLNIIFYILCWLCSH